MCLGESTVWWPPLGCHIGLLSRDVHVWMYPISNFWKIFTIIFHIMLEYSLGKRLENKLFHFILQSGILEYICENKCNVHVCSKTLIYSKNNLNDFLYLWKLKVYWTMSFDIIWTMLAYHVTNLKFFISKNEFFQQECDKCVVNWKFDK